MIGGEINGGCDRNNVRCAFCGVVFFLDGATDVLLACEVIQKDCLFSEELLLELLMLLVFELFQCLHFDAALLQLFLLFDNPVPCLVDPMDLSCLLLLLGSQRPRAHPDLVKVNNFAHAWSHAILECSGLSIQYFEALLLHRNLGLSCEQFLARLLLSHDADIEQALESKGE